MGLYHKSGDNNTNSKCQCGEIIGQLNGTTMVVYLIKNTQSYVVDKWENI